MAKTPREGVLELLSEGSEFILPTEPAGKLTRSKECTVMIGDRP